MSRWKDYWDMLVRKLKINRGQSGFRTVPHPAGYGAVILTTYAPTVAGLVAQVVTPPTRGLVLIGRVSRR